MRQSEKQGFLRFWPSHTHSSPKNKSVDFHGSKTCFESEAKGISPVETWCTTDLASPHLSAYVKTLLWLATPFPGLRDFQKPLPGEEISIVSEVLPFYDRRNPLAKWKDPHTDSILQCIWCKCMNNWITLKFHHQILNPMILCLSFTSCLRYCSVAIGSFAGVSLPDFQEALAGSILAWTGVSPLSRPTWSCGALGIELSWLERTQPKTTFVIEWA